MEVTYELTQKDFFDAFVAHRNRSAVTKRFLWLPVILACGGVLLLAIHPNIETLSQVVPPFGAATVIAATRWIVPWWAARNQFSKQPSAQGPRTVQYYWMPRLFTGDGTAGRLMYKWKTYVRFLEAKRQFLLYPSPYVFNIVPKRALTPEQVSEFRTLALQNISRSR